MKPTLKHQLPNGTIASRQTARKYTHVLLLKYNPAAVAAEIESHRAERLTQAVKRAKVQYAQWIVEQTIGIGGQVPYWPGQGGCDGNGRTHAQDDWQYELAVKYLEQYVTATEYVGHVLTETTAEIDAEVARANRLPTAWHVISWHSRADLATPKYSWAGDSHRVEVINGGKREAQAA